MPDDRVEAVESLARILGQQSLRVVVDLQRIFILTGLHQSVSE